MLKYLRDFARSVRATLDSAHHNNSKQAAIQPPFLRSSELRRTLALIPNWQDKTKAYQDYSWSESEGLWVLHSHVLSPEASSSHSTVSVLGECTDSAVPVLNKIHYGCGSTLLDGWLNVDAYPSELISATNYRQINLLDRHPYGDLSIRFGFAEDVIEHFTQAESIFFLSEVYRSLMNGGVLRLSFPGLEGVLDRHYSPPSSPVISAGEIEAYSIWDHYHFYSRDELELVAKHLGFSRVQFVEYGLSAYDDLSDLDTRSEQIGLNTYVELTK